MTKRRPVKWGYETRLQAARIAGQICQGNGDEISHRLLSVIVLVESYLSDGANKAAKMLGWETVQKKTKLTLIDLQDELRKRAGPPP